MNRFVFIFALFSALACGAASAFWGWSDSGQYSDGRADSNADMQGDARAEGEMEFTFDFTGRMKADGDFKGDTDTDTNWGGYTYDYPYWYGVPNYQGPYGVPYAPMPQQ